MNFLLKNKYVLLLIKNAFSIDFYLIFIPIFAPYIIWLFLWMNSKRNKIFIILKISCIFLLPILLQSFSFHRNNNRKIQKIVISRQENTQHIQQAQYITNDAVENLLFSAKNAEEYTLQEIKINALEKMLAANPMVEHADIYLTIDGVLKIVIKQREPIARMVRGGQFYYMDIQGKRMPLSDASSARVPLVRGVEEPMWEDAHIILKHIYMDHFLRENIVELSVNKGKFFARLRGANFSVCLGKSDDINLKFNNLKAFYKKAAKDNFLDRYTEVNLQYYNQVVCTHAHAVVEQGNQ